MPRKDSEENSSKGHGLNDVIGIVLIGVAALLFLSLFSHHPDDLNKVPPPEAMHNLVGKIGAYLANAAFFAFGAAAYLIPCFLLLYGVAQFITSFEYLNRRWGWAIVMVIVTMEAFQLYGGPLETLRRSLNAPSAGGALGGILHAFPFSYFGTAGATIIILILYFIGLLYLTNHSFREVLALAREMKPNFAGAGADGALATARPDLSEKELEKKARELEKQAKKLKEEAAREEKEKVARVEGDEAEALPKKAMLGADMQPVPEPTVRDLSIPVARPEEAGATKKAKGKSTAPETAPMHVGDVIRATEIPAATTADILGGKNKPKTEEWSPSKGEPVIAEVRSLEVAEDSAASLKPLPEVDEPLPIIKPKPGPKKNKPITVASVPLIGNYQLPPMDFFQYPDQNVKPTESKEELMANARLMQNTLAQFGIEVQLGDITKGPTITRYELHPAPGVKLEKIAGLNNNIAAALKAERINILAPVPGKSSVGVEVPNLVKTKVIMRDLLESPEWKNSKARIPLALGKDVYGNPIIADLAEMPHLLIAGSTGSGKSVCINSIVGSLLYKFGPDQVRFVMIDPKVVELQQYNVLPHLVVPVVTDPKKVILALRWVVNEMEKRYQIFAKVGVRNIKSFNERPKDKPKAAPSNELELPLTAKKERIEAGADGFAVELDEEIVVPREDDIIIPEKLSYIVVIIDELADLMLVAPADVEMAIARITQMARAAGIHCIVATQRPSVDVITGVIKANIPARIAFQVASRVDSRTILDAMGAHNLLGKGDMLYLPPGSAKLIRAQGVLITDHEIQCAVDFIAKQGKPSYEMEIHQQLQKPVSSSDGGSGGGGGGAGDEDEDIIEQCIEVIRSEQKASVSLLQRRLRLGYTRAARIMDELENRGIVGPSKGAEPRDILIDLDGGGADGAGQ
ncbi:MAG: cell division protein FtsK [Verrucomicrobia bacterium]|nr:cell division protein FtsK [Verrucomicrobiota bacterium]